MPKTNTSPLSGTRDFLPLDVLRRSYVVEIIERVFQSYGFEPLETPTMERLETLLGKYGEEGDQLIFRVMKRGEKLNRMLDGEASEDSLADSGLRYDLTVPLARVAAEYQTQLPRVFKRYQIQPVFRADRPAKGRFREFFQCDLDIVGTKSRIVEAEVLNAAAQVFHNLGFRTSSSFSLRLNHRRILTALMHVSGVPHDLEERTIIAIDKLDKIGIAGVRDELLNRNVPRPAVQELERLLKEVPQSNQKALSWLEQVLSSHEEGLVAVQDLLKVLSLIGNGPASKHIRIDPYLARGLSYYTGPIFEVDFEGFSGSAGGGGRYDNLIGMFAGRPIPACGFSFGLERVLLILEQERMFPERLSGQPQALMTIFSDETVEQSLSLASQLRSEGIRVDIYPEPGKYGKQFKYADQRGIRFAILLSPHEIEEGVVSVKDLSSGNQVKMHPKETARWLDTHSNEGGDHEGSFD